MARQIEADLALKAALVKAKQAERAAYEGPVKRRANDFLVRYLALPLHSVWALRPEEEFRARSYSRAKQVLGLIDHLFVKYRVPLFLYRSMLSADGLELVFETRVSKKPNRETPDAKYRRWFLAVAQGESFAKATRGFFTKREAHFFLQAPANNGIEQNILWARAAAIGLPPSGCDYLIQRLDRAFLNDLGDRLPDLLRFYVEAWPQMRGYDRDEITDFVRAVARNANFSFKGRTFGSMRKLCEEWHRLVHTGTVREYRSWPACLAPWETRKPGQLIRAEELTNNRELSEEGRSQRHCVLTYTGMCISGRCQIVSLRWYGVSSHLELPVNLISRLTIEVSASGRWISQIRGKLNRRATDDEMRIVRQWAGDLGLQISDYA